MAHREGFHYGPCSTTSAGVFRVLVLAGLISAVLFWPTVVAVATTVALIAKVTLIALAVVAVLAAAVAVAIAVRRRHSAPSALLVTVESDRNRLIEDQLAALTTAVQRLERDRTPALSASAHIVRLDPQTLALLTAMANSASQRSRALPEGWDVR
jgi:low affinity Fe/Cu permease